MRWVYAGELGPSGGLDWQCGQGGNIPKAGLVPDLDDTGLYLLIRRLAWEGRYEGRDPDFDASALKVNGTQLVEILVQHFGKKVLATATGNVKVYLELAQRLGASKYVALVAVAM